MNSAPPGPDARCADRTVIRQIYEADTLREARSALWHEGNSGAPSPVPRQYSAGNQMLELSARLRRRSRLDDCRAAPPASAPALPRWRPSSARPRERGLAPSARRLQAHGDTAPTPPDGSVLLDRAGQSVVRVETAPSDRDPDTVPRWRDLVPLDFFMVPCRPARALRSRRIRSPSPTSRPFQNIPTVHWASRQIVGAFPDDSAPVYLLRDRDAVYGDVFRQRVTGMGIGEVLPTARGRMPSRSDSSARSRASAWTTSSSSASGTCDASSPCTSRTITGLALTSRSTRLHPLGGRSSRLSSAPSSRFPKLGRGVFLEGLERSGPGFGEGQVHGSRTKHRQAAPARAPCFSTLRGRAHLARQRARQIVFGCLR
jgi:hypothetical protein